MLKDIVKIVLAKKTDPAKELKRIFKESGVKRIKKVVKSKKYGYRVILKGNAEIRFMIKKGKIIPFYLDLGDYQLELFGDEKKTISTLKKLISNLKNAKIEGLEDLSVSLKPPKASTKTGCLTKLLASKGYKITTNNEELNKEDESLDIEINLVKSKTVVPLLYYFIEENGKIYGYIYEIYPIQITKGDLEDALDMLLYFYKKNEGRKFKAQDVAKCKLGVKFLKLAGIKLRKATIKKEKEEKKETLQKKQKEIAEKVIEEKKKGAEKPKKDKKSEPKKEVKYNLPNERFIQFALNQDFSLANLDTLRNAIYETVKGLYLPKVIKFIEKVYKGKPQAQKPNLWAISLLTKYWAKDGFEMISVYQLDKYAYINLLPEVEKLNIKKEYKLIKKALEKTKVKGVKAKENNGVVEVDFGNIELFYEFLREFLANLYSLATKG